MSWHVVSQEEQDRMADQVMEDFRRHCVEREHMPKRTQCPCCGAVSNKPWEDLFSPPVMGVCPNQSHG